MVHLIPRHLHQIWWSWGPDGALLPRDEGPPTRERFVAWRHTHADYAYTLWNRAASWAFMDRQPPHRRQQFAAYARHIQRCDMFRILILQQHGGIYADMDLWPLGRLDQLWQRYPHAGLIVATETVLTPQDAARMARKPIRQGMPEHPIRIANYWLAARPGHPLLEQMLVLMQSRAHLLTQHSYDILYTTGPDVVTTVVHHDGHAYDDLVVLDAAASAEFFVHDQTRSWRF